MQGLSHNAWHAPHIEDCGVATVAKGEFPLRGTGTRQTVTLWNDLKRIDIGIELLDTGGELWREFRVAFPFALDKARNPFEAVSAKPAANAALPAVFAFLKADAPNVRVTAVKKAEDGNAVIVRLVEMEGRDGTVALDVGRRVKSARRTDMIEYAGAALEPHGQTVTFPVGHHAIETVSVEVEE